MSKQIQLWSDNLDERTSIESFFEWLDGHDLKLIRSGGPEWETPPPKSLGEYLDEYHEIDRGQLDRERRQLLSDMTASRKG